MTDFEAIIKVLDVQEVSYIVVGGMAAIIHGSSRLTLDFDIVYDRSKENLGKLVKALAPSNPYLRGIPPGLPFEWSVKTLELGLNFTLTTSLGPIDLLGEITAGGGYQELIPKSVEVELFGYRCKALDLPTLIKVKRAVARPKDLDILSELESLLGEEE